MLTPGEIKTFMDADRTSDRKLRAMTGKRYYDGNHDIKNRRIFFIDADGNLQEDTLKNNIKISHPFHRELTDQVVQYILSGEDPFIRSDDPELQAELDDRFNENEKFLAELYDMLTGVVSKGFDYMYSYRDKDGRSVFQHADCINLVEVKENTTDDELQYMIRWYKDGTGSGKKTVKRIQVFGKDMVWFFCQVDDGKIKLDDSQKINPRPYTMYGKKGEEKTYQNREGDYGQIPFYRMDNNCDRCSDLFLYKDLMDDYDVMNCGLSNNIEDTNEALYVVSGFDGDNLDKLMMNIKAKKHIGVSEEGGVDIKTVDIPVEARKAKMEMDEQNIFRFGFGLDTYGLRDTAATTNIAIKSAYSLLDLKANKLIIRLKQFLRILLDVALAEINHEKGTDYRQKDVYIKFKPEIPTNALENEQIELTKAQKRQTEIGTLLNLQTQLDHETLMQLITEQLELDYEDIKDKLPQPEEPELYPTAEQDDLIE